MSISILNRKESVCIRGGGENIKPTSRPRDDYDDEKTITRMSTLSSNSEEDKEFDWKEWFKKWLSKD